MVFFHIVTCVTCFGVMLSIGRFFIIYVHYIFTVCPLYIHYIFTICSLYIHYMFIEYSPCVYYIFTIYSLYIHCFYKVLFISLLQSFVEPGFH